jgi:hypothetical protein
MSVNQDTAMRRALIDKQTSLTHNIISSQTLYTNQQTPTAKHFLYMNNFKIMIFIICCKVCSICSFSPRMPNLEIFSIYSNKFSLVRIQFHLSRASGKWVSVKTAYVRNDLSFVIATKYTRCIPVIKNC